MKLFIDNLPFGISKAELLNMFKEFGEVAHANLVNDRQYGKIKGICFCGDGFPTKWTIIDEIIE